jgi:uncharacterized protein (DUF2141 family)
MTAAGTYVFRWSISNAPCTSTFDDVTIGVVAATTWYGDSDGDGAGDPAVMTMSCAQPSGYVSTSNDQCPLDPDKIAPGQCGCGIADTDDDGDGIANCNDPCDNGSNGESCEDGDPCTTGETLLNCQCQGGQFQDADGDGTCDANDLCPGGPEPGTACDDLNACTTDEQIQSDCTCGGGVPIDPNDGDPCTLDTCDPITGVSNVFQDTDGDGTCDANDLCPGGPEPGTACDDLNACTTGEQIQSDCTCGGGVPVDPNDGDPCTLDTCDPITGVSNVLQDADGDGTCDANDLCPGGPEPGTACDDQNACTTGEQIQSDCTCGGGVPVDPNDGDPCTLDTCDPITGVSNAFQDTDGDGTCDANDLCPGGPEPGTACDDLNACTTGEQIQSDCTCGGGVPVDTNDGNACTVDGCDPVTGVSHVVIDPDDGDPCTVDSCDPDNGVVNQPIELDSISGPDTVYVGSTLTYSITLPTGSSTFDWDLPAGWVTNDSSSSVLTVISGGLPFVTVQLCVNVTANGCLLDTCLSILIDGTVSVVGSGGEDLWFTVYPNPSNGTFQVAPAGATDKTVDIQVFDALGQRVGTPVVLTGRQPQRLDLQEMANGIYFLRATREGQSQVLELIIQR